MPLPRIIPKPIFQIYALVLLFCAWGGALVVAVTGGWPMSMLVALVPPIVAGFVVWIGATLVWVVVVLPARLFADFPTLEETLARTGATSLGEAIRIERAKIDRAATGTVTARRRRNALMAAAGAVLTIAFGVATVLVTVLLPDRFFLFPPLATVASAGLTVVYVVRFGLTFLER